MTRKATALSTTDALGNVTTWTYEPVFNEPTSMTDPNGRTTPIHLRPTRQPDPGNDALGQTRNMDL